LSISCSQLKKVKNQVSSIDYKSYVDKRVRPTNYLNMAWAKNLDPKYNSGNRPIGFASPTISDDVVYMGTLSGDINAFNSDNGQLIWTRNEGQPLNAKVSLFKDNIIYGSMYGRLFSRNSITAKINYSIDLGAPVESAPLVSDGKLYVHLRDHKIVALDAETGKVFWTYQRSIPFKITLQRVSRPISYGESIIVGFADGYLVKIDKNEGIVQWETVLSKAQKFVDVDLTPIVFNNQIIAGSAAGKLSFINPTNGLVTKTVNIIAGHSPLMLGKELFVGSIFGELYKLDSSGQITSKQKISKFSIGSIASWRGMLAISTMGEDLLVLDPYDLSLKHSWKLGTEVSSTFGDLITDGNILSLYSSRNRLYVFKQL
jgi:outer membrane protein assembly factor BamB